MDENQYQHLFGTVFKKTIGNYFVHVDDRIVICEITPRLRKELLYPIADPNSLPHIVVGVRDIDMIDPVAVGDQVRFVEPPVGRGLIVEVLPRKSELVRRSAGQRALEQVIVANVDQVVPVISAAQPALNLHLLDRYLVASESMDLPVLICITKTDLIEELREFQHEIDVYRQIGYPLVMTSAITGDGIQELKESLENKVSVFVGKSGSGKTSLLNSIQPGLGLKINEVNRVTGKGRHTTSNLEMYPIQADDGSQGCVVDTPGMREFGFWELGVEELALMFPEMRPLVGKCKFGLDCSHVHEPGCAIRQAVEKGKIDDRRYQSYLRLRED